jgi:superfamily II DNA helicase RecQ
MLCCEFPSTIRLALTATQEFFQTQSLLAVAQMPQNTSIERCSCNSNNCRIEIVAVRDLKNKQKGTQFQYDSLDMFQRFNRAEHPQATIFVISKREAANLCNALQSLCIASTQISANEITFFHADLDTQARKDRMHAFKAKAMLVIVATTSFGTGVNYPSVRLILHYVIPETLVEYLQNSGRGGRDGEVYLCVLYFHTRTCTNAHGFGFMANQRLLSLHRGRGTPRSSDTFCQQNSEGHSSFLTLIQHTMRHHFAKNGTIVVC